MNRLDAVSTELDVRGKSVADALVHLIRLGYVRQLDPVMGMMHYEVTG